MRCSRSVAARPVAVHPSVESNRTANRMIFRGSHTQALNTWEWRVPLALLIGVYFFSGLSPIATSFDSRWNVYIAESLWNQRNTNLDEYAAVLGRDAYYALECVDAQGNVRAGPQEHCNGHW